MATIFDQQQPVERAAIIASCDAAFEQPYAGFEHLLRAEIAPAMQAWFVRWFVAAGEWPQALRHLVPAAGAADDAYGQAFHELFMHKKGDDYLTVFFEQCQVGHFPATMMATIAALKQMVAPPPPAPPAEPANLFE